MPVLGLTNLLGSTFGGRARAIDVAEDHDATMRSAGRKTLRTFDDEDGSPASQTLRSDLTDDSYSS